MRNFLRALKLALPYRGRLVLFFQIAIGVGIVIATVVGATRVIDWRVAIGMAAVPAAIMFALMLRLPESPRWLAREGHTDRAREALARVRHPDSDLSGELGEISENVSGIASCNRIKIDMPSATSPIRIATIAYCTAMTL